MTFTEYAGRTVLVTGASSGIGEAVARRLVDLDAHVVALARREPTVEGVTFVPLDLTSPASVEAAAAKVTGHVDALFNCAGAVPMADPREILKVNFLGTRLLTDRVVEKMTAGGAIANTSSDAGYGWRKQLPLVLELLEEPTFEAGLKWYEKNAEAAGHTYGFSKDALNVWTLQQAQRLIKDGIRINTSSPGVVQTPMLDAIEGAYTSAAIDPVTQPSGRRSSAEEQAGPLLFLNSDSASYVNGADIVVDGGYWAGQSLAGAYWN